MNFDGRPDLWYLYVGHFIKHTREMTDAAMNLKEPTWAKSPPRVLLNASDSRELLAGVLGCPADLVDDVVQVWESPLREG